MSSRGPRRRVADRVRIGRVCEHELWTGVITWCRGYHAGLPIWTWGTAPSGLVTPAQLAQAGLRRRTGQGTYGLLVWAKGSRVSELLRIDLAVLPRTQTPALLASVAAMQKAHRTCKTCGRDTGRWLPTSTWKCDRCYLLAEQDPAVAA